MSESKGLEVYKAITSIIGVMAETGIGKDSRNTQGWNYRGIDAVYNALAPLLAENGLIIFTRVINRSVTEKQSKNGGKLFYVVLDCEFDFVSSKDGSKHTVRTVGEAMDSGDKASNKAMSIALKYAAFQTFFIPTEVTVLDADGVSHAVSGYPLDENAKSWIETVKAQPERIHEITDKPYQAFIKQKAAI